MLALRQERRMAGEGPDNDGREVPDGPGPPTALAGAPGAGSDPPVAPSRLGLFVLEDPPDPDPSAPGRPLHVTSGVRALLGEEAGKPPLDPDAWMSSVHPDDRTRAGALVRAVRSRGRGAARYRVRDAAGVWREILDERTRVAGVGVVGCWLEVAPGRGFHEGLLAREERFRALLDQAADGVTFLRDSFAALDTVLDHYRRRSIDGEASDPGLDAIRRLEEQEDLDYLRALTPRALERTGESLRRIGAILRGLGERSNGGGPLREPVDLAAAVASVLAEARDRYERVAQVETILEPVPPVPAAPGEIREALRAVVDGAVRAVAEAVRGTGNRGRIRVHVYGDGAWVVVAVRDTGLGVPPEVRGSVFEPFPGVVDLAPGHGAVRAVVEDRHGGSFEVEARPGRGTTHRLRLPRTPESDAQLRLMR